MEIKHEFFFGGGGGYLKGGRTRYLQLAYPKSLAPGNVQLPPGHVVVVDEKAGVQHEIAMFEGFVQLPLFQQHALLERLRQVKREGSSSSTASHDEVIFTSSPVQMIPDEN